MKELRSIEKIKKIFEVAKLADEPVLLIGKHGIGKSESVQQFCKENGYFYQPLFLSHQETADLIGIPVEKDGKTIWSKPVWLQQLEEESKNRDCVLFLDELNRAQLDVRQVALQLVLDKQIHQHRLPDNTFIVAAINPSEDEKMDYQVDEIDPALMDRFLPIYLEPDAKEWLEYASSNHLHPLIIKFISKYPEYLYYIDENNEIYPTNRSWTKLSKLLMSFEEKINKQEIDKETGDIILTDIINGKIGPIVGYKFFNFYKTEKSFNIDNLMQISKQIEFEVGKDTVKEVLNLIIEANDYSSNMHPEDIYHNSSYKKLYTKINESVEKIKKEFNPETAEIHYIIKQIIDKYFENNLEYYIPMSIALLLASEEAAVSYIKKYDKETEKKNMLGYVAPEKIDKIIEILEENIETEK